MKIETDWKATFWTSVKAHCPICKKHSLDGTVQPVGYPKRTANML